MVQTSQPKGFICHRCGRCCHNQDGIPCRFLVRLPNGRTICRIYKKRQKEGFMPLTIDSDGRQCVAIGTFGTKCQYENTLK